MLNLLRMFLMGVHFLAVGVIGLLIGLLRPFHPDNTRLCARLYSLPALRILGLRAKLDVRPLLEAHRSCVIVANHQSNYDLFVYGSVMPRRTVTIGKKSLKWVPFFGQIYWLAGNVLIDRGNAFKAKQAMATTADTLQHKDTSIWIFAEGTRNHGKGLLPFKKGAFQMAIKAGVPIVPVCCSTYRKHMRLNRWRSGEVTIRSLPPIPTTGLGPNDIQALMERCHAQMRECILAMDREIERAI
ncbi:MAG TPA: 1-acylglycerol-3-phosphate O-acyltransferase [Rhodocyclaceae bacterium]|nr:1-acylglycerol-3-phosphate O-acyltransferase [Rhodocyclaceae bacterium]